MFNLISHSPELLKKIILVYRVGGMLALRRQVRLFYLNQVKHKRKATRIPDVCNLKPNVDLPQKTSLRIEFSKGFIDEINGDAALREKVLGCLSISSVFRGCRVSVDAPDFMVNLPDGVQASNNDEDFILKMRRASYLDGPAIERMLQAAYKFNCPVVPNYYGLNSELFELSEDGSIDAESANSSPVILSPVKFTAFEVESSVRLRSDAYCFLAPPSAFKSKDRPVVTTVIRFHKSNAITELKKALFCLYAMKDCDVIPFIAAQDLDALQLRKFNEVLAEFDWAKENKPRIRLHQSQDGKGDLRSKMLNESLMEVKSRYAAFLDYDDLLMPYAYSWLIGRLEQTGKAVSFGRVYSTNYHSQSGLIVSRSRLFEYGYTYKEFVKYNYVPLHSFMLDLSRVDLSKVAYFDDQLYMEDYLLMLQLITKDNTDWDSLRGDFYIGDYIHSIDRTHSLATSDRQEWEAMTASPQYKLSDKRIADIRAKNHPSV